jgi:mycothiol system anti-sigma-R factor
MDCQETHLRVYEYLDGELTVWRRKAITRHLVECPPCGEAFSFEIDLRRVVVSKCVEEVPAELKARIAMALGIVEESGPTSE